MPKSGDIDINNQGFTDEQYEQLNEAKKKGRKKEELTEEQKQLLIEKEEKRKNRDSAISILRGISIRMPLLIYGADVNDENEEITIGLVRHSTFPWSRFTGLTQPSNFGTKESIPRIIIGKAYFEGEKMYMPVSVEANHGFVDGLHLAKYLEEFEKQLAKY